MGQSKNYRAYRAKLLNSVSLGLLVQMEQYLAAPERAQAEDAQTLADEARRVLRQFQTHRLCPRCGTSLYLSDLPQYDFVCHTCDENF